MNICLPKEHASEIELIRSTEEEKGQQIEHVRNWQEERIAVVLPPLPPGEGWGEGASAADVSDGKGLVYLQNAARERRNVLEAVKTHSLRQISYALYDLGGEHRRNM